MQSKKLSRIQADMDRSLKLFKELVDASVPFLGSEQEKTVRAMWEEYLKESFRYVKQKKIPFNIFTFLRLETGEFEPDHDS